MRERERNIGLYKREPISIPADKQCSELTVARLCPGTLANVFAIDSLVALGRDLMVGTSIPARNAAARDILGLIEGTAFVDGTGRALNAAVFDFTSTLIVPPPRSSKVGTSS